MSEISIKRVCCTCLSTDRKLSQLCRIVDGINLLYMLLTHDPEAYKEGFYKDTASLLVCWECSAVMHRIKRFQVQACNAQKQLTCIADGRNVKLQTFSHLATTHNKADHIFQSSDMTAGNFIDCGLQKEIKVETDSDVPLSVFYNENDSDADNIFDYDNVAIEPDNVAIEPSNVANEPSNINQPHNFNYTLKIESSKPDNRNLVARSKPSKNTKQAENIMVATKPSTEETNDPVKIVVTSKKKTKMKYSKYFLMSTLNEEERKKTVEYRKTCMDKSAFKCDNCLIEFKNEVEVINHNTDLHSKRDNHSQCDICHSYTEELPTHRQSHYDCYNCMLCTHTTYTHIDIIKHLKRNHREICSGKKKASKRKQNGTILDELSKYNCPECDLSFQNKDLRWKHIQKAHREGYKCRSCDKKFAFKNNLERHERIHQGPIPREECPECHKMIRIDLVKVHSRIHTDRQKYTCVECDKSFISRATYESHLKNAQAHATVEVCRHKCTSCQKGYRSRGELRDHINYYHKGRAEHKCPICGKGLATKRCIRRHVRRAHEGIKENAKDKICQQCGKAFRDKKGVIEHERVHTGARPLSCGTCGRAFRQKAALYAHARRVHRAPTGGA